jgi:hypothetical protein
MATLKFKDPSPYKQERPKAPEADFLYSRWVEEIDGSRTERFARIVMK